MTQVAESQVEPTGLKQAEPKQAKPFKLAIAISGAVSLGAYEAGVMYEIIKAIGEHNTSPQTRSEDKILIDVIAGASAGGMTAAILAQKLMFQGGAFMSETQNPLYDSWVVKPDIGNLLTRHDGDDWNKSILSSGLITKIAQELLLERYQENDKPKPQEAGTQAEEGRHPAAADQIALGMALSNLNGLDHGIPTFDSTNLCQPGEMFTQTCYQDCFITQISEQSDEVEIWDKIALMSRACGAFPFAFQAIPIERSKSEAAYQERQNILFPGYELPSCAQPACQPGACKNPDCEASPCSKPGCSDKMKFIYTDGGVFNNYPLGIAKNLVNQIDTGRDYEKRFYLYVAPGTKKSTANTEFKDPSLLNTGLALAQSVFNQSAFQDWLMTSKINQAIHALDQQAESLQAWLFEALTPQEAAQGLTAAQKRADRAAGLNQVSEPMLEALYRFPGKLLFSMDFPASGMDATGLGLTVAQFEAREIPFHQPISLQVDSANSWVLTDGEKSRWKAVKEAVSVKVKHRCEVEAKLGLELRDKLKIYSLGNRRKDFERLQEQYLNETNPLAAQHDQASLKAWIEGIQVLEQTGRLGDRDEMKIYTITASDDELSGEGISAFTGFLNQAFRQYDYLVGRKKALEFLQRLAARAAQPNQAAPGQLPLRHLPFRHQTARPQELEAIAAALQDLPVKGTTKLKDLLGRVKDKDLDALEQALADRALALLEQLRDALIEQHQKSDPNVRIPALPVQVLDLVVQNLKPLQPQERHELLAQGHDLLTGARRVSSLLSGIWSSLSFPARLLGKLIGRAPAKAKPLPSKIRSLANTALIVAGFATLLPLAALSLLMFLLIQPALLSGGLVQGALWLSCLVLALGTGMGGVCVYALNSMRPKNGSQTSGSLTSGSGTQPESSEPRPLPRSEEP